MRFTALLDITAKMDNNEVPESGRYFYASPKVVNLLKSTDELLRLFGEVNRGGQTILMVTHSVKAASCAGRVLFIRDGEVFHQLYRGDATNELFYQRISETLTMLAGGGEAR